MKLILSKECAERGCMAHDDRVDGPGVVIEQAERQEPVAWIYNCQLYWENPSDDAKPLYTTPPQRQPLTDAERNHLWETIYDHGHGKYMGEASRAQRERAFAILKKIGGEHD